MGKKANMTRRIRDINKNVLPATGDPEGKKKKHTNRYEQFSHTGKEQGGEASLGKKEKRKRQPKSF